MFLLTSTMAYGALQQCAVYLVKKSTCTGLSVTKTYGSCSSTNSCTETCYDVFNQQGGTTGVYKFITAVTCSATNGYTQNLSGSEEFCIGSMDASPTTITYYAGCKCYNYDTWNNSWSDYNSTYQRDSGTRTNCGTTSTIYRYRCNSGYYSANGYSEYTSTSGLGCTSCKTTCDEGHTSSPGANERTDCRAEADTNYSDSTGTFKYSAACCCGESCSSGSTGCLTDKDCSTGYTCLNGRCVIKFIPNL